jgi:hypothetical protein
MATTARAPMSTTSGTKRRSIPAVTTSADRNAAVTAAAFSRVGAPTRELTVAGSIPAASDTRTGRSPSEASLVRRASSRAGALRSSVITATSPPTTASGSAPTTRE